MVGFAARLVAQGIPRRAPDAATTAPLRLAITPDLLPLGVPRATAIPPLEDPEHPQPVPAAPHPQPPAPRVMNSPRAPGNAVSRPDGRKQPVVPARTKSPSRHEVAAAVAGLTPRAASDTGSASGPPSRPPPDLESATRRPPPESAPSQAPPQGTAPSPQRGKAEPVRPAPQPAVVNVFPRPPARQRRAVTVRIGRIEIVSPVPPAPAPVITPPSPAPLPAATDPLAALWPDRAGYAR